MAKLPVRDMTLDYAPRRRDDVTSVELDGEAVLYADSAMLRLDRIGTVLWNCFDGEVTLHELSADLAAEFGTDPDVVANDVMEFTQRMGGHGLLTGVSGDV